MLKFQPNVEYLPGKYMYLADLLSRDYLDDPVEDDPEMVEVVDEVVRSLPFPDEMLSDLRGETQKDKGLAAVKQYYQNGWPKNRKAAEPESLQYWKLRADIFVEDGLVILDDQVIVPPTLRKKVLNSLHAAHQGLVKTKARARQAVYWPGITNEITNMVQECRVCERHRPANIKQPLIPHEIPHYRFQKVCADIAKHGGHPYLVVVDAMSKWLEIKRMSGTSSGVINELRSIFSTHGIPQIIYGDNNPLNSYECRSCAKRLRHCH